MSDTTYETDFLLWSEHQADALRRLRRGERANDIGWDHLIEEVEDLGRSETRATITLLRRGLDHLLKTAAWPQSSANPHWLAEARTLFRDATDAFTPSMTQQIDLASLYADAVQGVVILGEIDGLPAACLPAGCPWTLHDLLTTCDIRLLAARLCDPQA